MKQQRLISKLSLLPLKYKLIYLAIMAVVLFLPNLLLNHIDLKYFYFFYAFFVFAFVCFGFAVLGKKKIIATLKLWGIGTTIYLLFAITRIYSTGILSPYFNSTNLTDRWLYSLLLPLILLGTFVSGLIFIQITSPIEFLKFGGVGLKITLFMRVLQHSFQVFNDTKLALMMQNQWPDENKRFFDLKNSWLVIKSSPLLIRTAMRNILLYWFPWGWLMFEKKLKHICKKNP